MSPPSNMVTPEQVKSLLVIGCHLDDAASVLVQVVREKLARIVPGVGGGLDGRNLVDQRDQNGDTTRKLPHSNARPFSRG